MVRIKGALARFDFDGIQMQDAMNCDIGKDPEKPPARTTANQRTRGEINRNDCEGTTERVLKCVIYMNTSERYAS